MNKPIVELPRVDNDENDLFSQESHQSCINAIDIISVLNINKNYYKKTKLINHIYECRNCYREFKEYISLLEKIEAFCILSEDVSHKHISSHKRNFHSLNFLPRSLAYSVLIIFFAAFIVSRYFSPVDDNIKTISSQTRGLSFSTKEIFPRPFSSVSRVPLYFKWESLKQSLPQGICLYNSNLELIWESDYSYTGMIMLPNKIKSILVNNQQYYWTIRSKSESGTAIYSMLLPFFIKD